MDKPPIDLKKLAAEAAQEAYSPRAKKCWPWSHQWTMWKRDFEHSPCQSRRCLLYGKTKEKFVW